MDIILQGGPLDGQTVKVPPECRSYSTRVAGQRVVSDETDEKDPATRPRTY